MTVADNPKVEATFDMAAMIVVGAFIVGVGVGAMIMAVASRFSS